MAHLVFDHPAITILHHPEVEKFEIIGRTSGEVISYKDIKEMGEAMCNYIKSKKSTYNFFN